jgi:hypothetical protein
MNNFLIAATALSWCFIGAGCWLGWQLLRQNGRVLLRIDEIENRLNEYELRELEDSSASDAPRKETNGEQERSTRFSNRSLARSKLKRAGLKAGTAGPEFRLPRLNGGELALADLRGRPVLLVLMLSIFCSSFWARKSSMNSSPKKVPRRGKLAVNGCIYAHLTPQGELVQFGPAD